MPLFTRNDCLEIYLDIVNHPEKHRFGRWYDAVEKLQYFTNATAVAGMQRALAVVKDPAKYWPDMGPSLWIWSVEDKIKHQQEFIEGKRPLVRTDTIVFDE